jgi:hypothetical protein
MRKGVATALGLLVAENWIRRIEGKKGWKARRLEGKKG